MSSFDDLLSQLLAERLRYEVLRSGGASHGELVNSRQKLLHLRASVAKARGRR